MSRLTSPEIERDRRKRPARSSVFTVSGELVAAASTTWIDNPHRDGSQ